MLSVPRFALSDALTGRDLAWVVTAVRLAAFFEKAAGLASFSASSAVKTDATFVKELRAAAAQMTAVDLLLDAIGVTSYAVAGANSFYDRVTPRRLMHDGTLAATVCFKSVMASGYAQDDRDDANGLFQELAELLLDKAGSDLASKSIRIQASDVISFVIRTAPEPADIWTYVGIHGQEAQIQRRAGATVSARFLPLFISAWTAGNFVYPKLRAALPAVSAGADAARLVAALATRASLSSELTHAICHSLNDQITDLLVDLDTSELRAAEGAERMRSLGGLVAKSAAKGSDSASDSDKVASILAANSDFQALRTLLEGEDVERPDYTKVVKAMAKHIHIAGLLYLASNVPVTKLFVKFKAARTPECFDKAFNSMIAFDVLGQPLTEWAVKRGVASLLINAKWSESNFWPWRDLLVPLITARSGHAAMHKYSSDNATFWSDVDRLRIAAEPLKIAFGFVGMAGLHRGSFASFYKSITERATHVDELPTACKEKAGLAVALVSIATGAMLESSGLMLEQLKAATESAVRPATFLPTDGTTSKAFAEFDKDLADVMNEVRRDAKYNKRKGDDGGGDGSASKRPSHDGGNDGSKGKGGGGKSTALVVATRVPPQQTSGRQYTQAEIDAWRTQLSKNVGINLTRFTVHALDQPSGLVFGNAYFVTIVAGKEDVWSRIPEGTCLGALCHLWGEQAYKRGNWCDKNCADQSHPRPDGLTDSDFVIVNLAAPRDAAETEMARAVIAARGSWVIIAGADSPAAQFTLDDVASSTHASRATFDLINCNGAYTMWSYAAESPRKGGRGSGDGRGRGGGGKGSPRGGGRGAKGGKGARGKGAPSGKGAIGKPNFQRQR